MWDIFNKLAASAVLYLIKEHRGVMCLEVLFYKN